jgi:cell division protein FtsZ
VLYQGVKGVTDLMVRPGLINLDFADVRAVMDEMGKAMMGTGEAEGEERAIQAAEKAIANPLLDEISLRGARGVLINITGGKDLTLFELDEAANRIREEVDSDANIIVGSTLDERMEGMMRVSVVATGIDASEIIQDLPLPRRVSVDEDSAGHSFRETEAVAPEESATEPDLFKSVETLAEGESSFPPTSPTRPAETDELPPPAYEEPVAQDEFQSENFVAPQAPLVGTPSDQAMARLRKAVQNSPGYGDAVPGMEEENSDTDRPRFGIGSLINRMSGQDTDKKAQAAQKQPTAPVAPPSMRQEEVEQDEITDPEKERIEVPAFLRRQAN